MYYVYILKGKRYYCGSTNDLKRRLQEHRRGKTQTTRIQQSYELVGYFNRESQELARELERKIKNSGHIERRTHNEGFIKKQTIV